MGMMITLELIEIILIAVILLYEILSYLDQRKIVTATLAFWTERARWYAARGRPREAAPELSLLREIVSETAGLEPDSGNQRTPGTPE